uniref:Kinesin family member 15 n=1 Tax=Varanus komodoensis TaxID=61221 RepID=A0A8D2KQS3_VARKO
EVKKLKEQLALFASGQCTTSPDVGHTDYMNRFLEAMLFLEKSEKERKMLLEKVAQLEDLSVKKEKFIQSNKMIVKFREDHITRLEKLHKEARDTFLPEEQQDFFRDLKEELKILREQVEHHPRIAKYAMENHILREENKQLRSLQSVKRAQEMDAQTMAELEKMFLETSRRECNDRGQQLGSMALSTDSNTAASMEKLKERLLHTQSELASAKQEHEEFKELTKKKQMELESELQSVQTTNQHLEKILEATKAYKRQEVSHLNKLHIETLKSVTTPTRAYQLRSRLVPRLTPEMLNQESTDTQSSREIIDDIFNEPMPPEMNEQAYEAVAEELQTVQEELSALQIKLDAEESKAIKLQQQVNKLEHHSSQMQELFASERSGWQNEKQGLLEKIDSLEKEYQDTQIKVDILKSEVHDLRIVLQSADKELSARKMEYDAFRKSQEKEINELSIRHMNVQLQLDNVRLEYEKILEGKTSLQDDYDNLQEIHKFETDQMIQQLTDSKQENEALKTELQVRKNLHLIILVHIMHCYGLDPKYITVVERAKNMDLHLLHKLCKEILCEELHHTSEQLSSLTQASKHHVALLQSAQEDLIKKEALIQELEDWHFLKNEYEFKKRQMDCVMESAVAAFPQSPKTPPNFDANLVKLLETHEQEIADQRASAVTLEHLVSELNEEREVKNTEILRLKAQLCELENTRLEMQVLMENNRNLQSQLEELEILAVKVQVINLLLLHKFPLMSLLTNFFHRLEKIKSELGNKETAFQEIVQEMERTRALESKAFSEKEELRSKLEELYEEREMSSLRKHMEFLAEENGKLVGHQNLNQRIQYLVKMKKENTKLKEVGKIR